MIKFPAQYHSFRKTTLGDNLITLVVDSNYSKDISPLVEEKIGTQYIVHLEDVTNETNINNTPRELTDRFQNKLHGLLGELAELKDVKPEEAKKKLKKVLIDKGMIEKSTKELDLKGQAKACAIVEGWIENHKTIKM